MMFISMIVLCVLTLTNADVSDSRDQQVRLEDIERDMLQSERLAKDEERQDRKLSQSISPPPPTLVNPKSHYGFVPVRTPESHVHAPPAPPQIQYQQVPHVNREQQYTQAYIQPQYYAQPSPVEQYRAQPPQQQYFQYENVPYVVDNGIGGGVGQSGQYYQPTHQQHQQQQQQQQQSFIYFQPYSSASSNIHSVVDAKGNVQYIMYVPASLLAKPEYENLVSSQYEEQAYSQEQPVVHQNQIQYEYAPESQSQKYYTRPQYVTARPTSSVPVKYTKVAFNSGTLLGNEKQQNQGFPSIDAHYRKEPQSLLDSYVPSILQYQLYKQQQQDQLHQPSLKRNAESSRGHLKPSQSP